MVTRCLLLIALLVCPVRAELIRLEWSVPVPAVARVFSILQNGQRELVADHWAGSAFYVQIARPHEPSEALIPEGEDSPDGHIPLWIDRDNPIRALTLHPVETIWGTNQVYLCQDTNYNWLFCETIEDLLTQPEVDRISFVTVPYGPGAHDIEEADDLGLVWWPLRTVAGPGAEVIPVERTRMSRFFRARRL